MVDPFTKIYDDLASRKNEASAVGPYSGGNGRIDRAVDLILNEDFPNSGTLLDVGGATGNLGYALRDLFNERITVDIAIDCRVPAESKGNRFICRNVDAQGLDGIEDCSVDLVVALDFIEHVLNPQNFASECYRVLKKNGRVLINTPNIQFWRHLNSLVVEGIFPHTSGDQEVYHGGHVSFFNFHDMDVIFSQQGFSEMKMHTRGLTPDPAPPIWGHLFKPRNGKIIAPLFQLSYADLIFSCKK